MKFIFHFLLLVFYITTTSSSLYSNFKDNVLNYLKVGNGEENKKILRNGDESDYGEVVPRIDEDRDFGEENNHEKTTIQYKKSERDKYNDHYRNLNYVKKREFYIEPKDDDTEKKPEFMAGPFVNSHDKNRGETEDKYQKRYEEDMMDVKNAHEKVQILKKAKKHEESLNDAKEFLPLKTVGRIGKERYHMDPVLNVVRSRDYRRRDDKSDDDSSSSKDTKDWKDEWKEHWMMKKVEALNSTPPTGDHVNMVGARPWGIQCGDPNQHDMPWGTCMLSVECEVEFRIYRGDYMCGRTQFVCCGMKASLYDMYQGFDVSFDDKSFSPGSEELKVDPKKKKKNKKENKDRKDLRAKRKKKIRKTIKKIVKEIQKLLDKQFRNGTKERKRRTKLLKKFIKMMKKQYKKDRKSVQEIHGYNLLTIDSELQKKLNHIIGLNKQFVTNSTFRDLIVNGKITKEGARMLLDTYPELATYIKSRRSNPSASQNEYLEYDIEYGYLYY